MVVVSAVLDVRLIKRGVRVGVVQIQVAHVVQAGHQVVRGFLAEHQFQVVPQVQRHLSQQSPRIFDDWHAFERVRQLFCDGVVREENELVQFGRELHFQDREQDLIVRPVNQSQRRVDWPVLLDLLEGELLRVEDVPEVSVIDIE